MNLQKELKFAAVRNTLPLSFSDEYNNFLQSKSPQNAFEVLSELEQKRLNTERRCKLSDHDAFNKVTSIAGSLHPNFTTGCLAEGALANLCLWNDNSPAYWPTQSHIKAMVWNDLQPALVGVLSKGKWHRKPPGVAGKTFLTSTDRNEIAKEAQERLQHLAKRARVSLDTLPKIVFKSGTKT